MSFKNFYKINLNKKILFLFFIFLFSFTQKVSAAELNLIPSFSSYEVGDNIKVRVTLSSSTSVNAVSGNIKFSTDTLTMTSVTKGGSVVSLWAVEPTYSNTGGTVNFEGVMLSGYTGSGGTVLTLNFKAKSAGTASANFSSSSVLASDGEGTNVLTRSGSTSFRINKPVEKKVEEKPADKKVETKTLSPKTETTETSNSKVDLVLPTIQIQKISADDSIDSFAVFSVNSVGKKLKSLYKVEIDGSPYAWDSQDAGVFTTPKLTKGDHRLSISMDTVNGDILSSSVAFSILSIPAPVITEYSESINENSYIVVKGKADPDTEVVLVFEYKLSESGESKKYEATALSDEYGNFTYLSEKVKAGSYELSAYYKVKSGFESEKSAPLKVNVNSENKVLLSKVTNTFSVVILIVALILLLLIIATWGWYKFLNYKDKHTKRLSDSKMVIAKSFEILDNDVDKQIKIFRKIKSLEPLTKEEKAFLKEFKRDIRAAEKVISDEVKVPKK